jgi:hypothetical protein
MFKVGQEIELLDYDTIVKKYGVGNKLNIKSDRFTSYICDGMLFGIDFNDIVFKKNKKFKIKEVCYDNTVFINTPGNHESYYIPFEFIKEKPVLDDNLFIL